MSHAHLLNQSFLATRFAQDQGHPVYKGKSLLFFAIKDEVATGREVAELLKKALPGTEQFGTLSEARDKTAAIFLYPENELSPNNPMPSSKTLWTIQRSKQPQSLPKARPS